MKVLVTTQRVLSWVLICPAEESTNKWWKMVFKTFPVVLLATALTGLVASAAFFVKFISTDLEASLYALYQISGNSGVFHLITVSIHLHKQIAGIIDSLQQIYNQSKN